MFIKIISRVGAILFLAIAGLLLLSSFSIHGVRLDARVVETGSMEPTIPTGSVVFVSRAEHYAKGDIIMFKRAFGAAEAPPVTHRVVEVHLDKGEYRYVTKGDANATQDTKEVAAEEVTGRVRLHVPWIGYALRAARTPFGFLVLVIVPLVLIIADEAQKIAREVQKRKALAKTLLLCVLAFGGSGFFVERAEAAFTASATIDSNALTTAVIPPPPFVPGPGDVVINEVMWAGSASSADDEWIELRNTTNESINLAGWKVDGLGTGTATVVIPSGTLAPNSFFLISNFVATASAISDTITPDYVTASVSLLNSGEQLTLKDAGDTVIDQTPTGAWASGENTSVKKSMERNTVPGDGTLAASWHTCADAGCDDTAFWDVEGSNYGTPRAANLSANDSTTRNVNPMSSEVVTEEAHIPVAETDKNVTEKPVSDQNSVGDAGDAKDMAGTVSEGVGDANKQVDRDLTSQEVHDGAQDHARGDQAGGVHADAGGNKDVDATEEVKNPEEMAPPKATPRETTDEASASIPPNNQDNN